MTKFAKGDHVKIIGVEFEDVMGHMLGMVLPIYEIEESSYGFNKYPYIIKDYRQDKTTNWYFTEDELEAVKADVTVETDDETIWEIRIDGGAKVHTMLGATTVALFINGVRAVKPDAILERRAWERF